MLQQSLAVFFVLALLLAAIWLLKKRGLATDGILAGSDLSGLRNLSWKNLGLKHKGRRLQLMERLVLTPQHSLHLISVDDELVLLATSPAGCQRVEPGAAFRISEPSPLAPLKSGASC